MFIFEERMALSAADTPVRKGKHVIKIPWTPVEDVQIITMVEKFGANWVHVSNNIAGRTGKQCRERYYNHLQENIKKCDFSQQEDQMILRLQRQHGNHWVRIMKELPGRTDNAVKNRFHALKRAHTQIIEGFVAPSCGATPMVATSSPNSAAMFPETPTSVAISDTPRATKARVFTWKGASIEYIPEEPAAEAEAEADTSLGIQVDVQDINNVLDCLSPLMSPPLAAQLAAAPAPAEAEDCFDLLGVGVDVEGAEEWVLAEPSPASAGTPDGIDLSSSMKQQLFEMLGGAEVETHVQTEVGAGMDMDSPGFFGGAVRSPCARGPMAGSVGRPGMFSCNSSPAPARKRSRVASADTPDYTFFRGLSGSDSLSFSGPFVLNMSDAGYGCALA